MYSKVPIKRTDPIIRTIETFFEFFRWKKGNLGRIFFVYQKEKNTYQGKQVLSVIFIRPVRK